LVEAVFSGVKLLVVDGEGLVGSVEAGRVSGRSDDFDSDDGIAMVIKNLKK
jgi:hypothetical protein